MGVKKIFIIALFFCVGNIFLMSPTVEATSSCSCNNTISLGEQKTLDFLKRPNVGVSGVSINTAADPGEIVPIKIAVNASPAVDLDGNVVTGNADPLKDAVITVLLTRLNLDPGVSFTSRSPQNSKTTFESTLVVRGTISASSEPVFLNAFMRLPNDIEKGRVQWIRAEIVSVKSKDGMILTAFEPDQDKALVTVNPISKDSSIKIRTQDETRK